MLKVPLRFLRSHRGSRLLLQLNEALPHLTEAASIDPDNAKYHYTLGLAKRGIGDETGAREDLRKAARLDEEDAEDRYQLRVQRNNSEQQHVGNKERDSAREVKIHEEDAPQVGRLRSQK